MGDKNKDIPGAVHNAMYQQWKQRGYATPIDTLMYMGILSKKSYEEWRFGHVPYLEKCCNVSLRKLSDIMHQMRVYACKQGWKESFCFYKQWGAKKITKKLRFSKSGDSNIEKWYATHFVDTEKVKELKAKQPRK